MFFFALGFSLNCIIWEPLSCLSQVFCWPRANQVIENSIDKDEVPKTVEQMAKVIEAIKIEKAKKTD